MRVSSNITRVLNYQIKVIIGRERLVDIHLKEIFKNWLETIFDSRINFYTSTRKGKRFRLRPTIRAPSARRGFPMSPIDMKIWCHLSGGRYSAVVVQNANTTLPCNWLADWPCTHPHALLTVATATRGEICARDVTRSAWHRTFYELGQEGEIGHLTRARYVPSSLLSPPPLCVSNLCFVCLMWRTDFSRMYHEPIFREKHKNQYFLITFR